MPIEVEICQDKICPGSLQLTQFYLEKIVLKINFIVLPKPVGDRAKRRSRRGDEPRLDEAFAGVEVSA
jgi:hypothetical protein